MLFFVFINFIMKNNIFFKSVFILLIGGLITKIISMFIKIVLARLIGTEGMGIYMLILPTFTLLMALAQLGFPVAISKLVSEETRQNKNLVFSVIPISLTLNIIIILILLFSSSFLSNTLLHEPRCQLALISAGFVLPFISISSILRGYFFGKNKMLPHVFSNITEDIVRLICLILFIPIFLKKGIEYAVCFVVLVNVISELSSILVLFFFLPKNFSISKKDIIPNKKNIKDIFNIGIPSTMSRIIGSIGAFLEPIILTSILIKTGYSNDYIINEYGILNGFVLPLVLIPSFFTLAISQGLIPCVSKYHSAGNYKYVSYKIKQAIFLSLLIGIPTTLIFEIFPAQIMNLIYNTTEGILYIKFLAPICLFHYIQSPLSSSLQAMGKALIAFRGTFTGTIIRIISLIIFSPLFGIWSLIISLGLSIIYTTMHQAYHIKKELST